MFILLLLLGGGYAAWRFSTKNQTAHSKYLPSPEHQKWVDEENAKPHEGVIAPKQPSPTTKSNSTLPKRFPNPGQYQVIIKTTAIDPSGRFELSYAGNDRNYAQGLVAEWKKAGMEFYLFDGNKITQTRGW